MTEAGAPTWSVRDATVEDAAACAAVYATYVRDTTVSLELEPPDVIEVARRIAAAQDRHGWLVLLDGPVVCGYAYAGPWRPRDGYRFSCETSVYVDPERRGHGGGRLLYQRLLSRVADLGLRTAIAGMTEPNPASAALHSSLGFVRIGTLPSVGRKFDAWHDVSLWSLDLQEPVGVPRWRGGISGG